MLTFIVSVQVPFPAQRRVVKVTTFSFSFNQDLTGDADIYRQYPVSRSKKGSRNGCLLILITDNLKGDADIYRQHSSPVSRLN